METKVKTPWYKYYDGVKEHLDYPDISVYELLAQSAAKHPDYISYNYFGYKVTYEEFISQIEKCARALTALGLK